MILPTFSLKQIDRGWDAIKAAVRNARSESYAKVGVLGASKKAARRGSKLTNVDLALIQEFGTATIPERSFVRATFEAKKEELIHLMRQLAPQVYAGEMSIEQMLNLCGAKLAAEMKNRITSGIAPPLSVTTLRIRERVKMTGKIQRTVSKRESQGRVAAAAFGGNTDAGLGKKLHHRLVRRMNRKLDRRETQAAAAAAVFGNALGEERPLVDTGQLLNSITWAVVKK